MKLIRRELRPEELAVEESLFHVANGYLGVRGNFEEGLPPGIPTIRGCYINGFYDNVELKYPERLYGFPEQAQRMVNLPDVQTMKLRLDGVEYNPFLGRTTEYERVLDTDRGLTTRRLAGYYREGGQVQLSVTRMASFTCPELFLTLYELEVAQAMEVEIESSVNCHVANFVDPSDPRVASERQQHIFFDGAGREEEAAWARCHTGKSGLEMAVCQMHRLVGEGTLRTVVNDSGFITLVRASLPAGGRLLVEKYTTLSDARRAENPMRHALQTAKDCHATGAEALLAEQKAFLDVFWASSRVAIEGDETLSEGMEYNLYMLLQSAGHDSISNVPAKGLSGEGYEGHYFWDTEIFILPFFLYTQPEMAKKLLDFRYSVLDGAREHARILGHARGALYPWRTITGSECSSYFPSGSAQYHITGDVAHSFLQYYYATGDLAYMAKKGAEVLLETARAWLCTGHWDREGRFNIADITGPDEYTCIVNNNFYTNINAQSNLLGAIAIYGELQRAGLHREVAEKIGLDEKELADFQRAADAMLLPYDEALGIHAQDDSFLQKPRWDFEGTPPENYPLLLHYHPLFLYRHQVCKQADTVLAYFLFEEGLREEDMKRSYEYYEEVTTHDSSLSHCVFSIMASRLGMGEKAYGYFHDTVRTDLDNVHKNTKDGIHTANMGGAYLALVSGFAGLRLRASGMHFRFTLPAQWTGYRFSVWYKGSLLAFEVAREGVTIELKEGPTAEIWVGDTALTVNGRTTVKGVVK